ncbi:MAG: O-antigen ligase family protein [Pseudomonadota bacterium]
MDPHAASQAGPEDRLVFFAFALTWFVYLFGGLYILGPVLGVSLTALVVLRYYVQGTEFARFPVNPVPAGVWVWIIGMLFMLVALEIAHAEQGLGTGQTIKSTIGWAKGWALFALFPLIGACLKIRLETLIKAAGWVALGTLIVTPILVTAPIIGLPEVLFVSPLKIVGGPGPEFFAVQFYSIEPTDGSSRWRFYTPWSPAAGVVGNMMLIFALNDRRRAWMMMGVASALVMIVLSKSRLALVAALFIWPAVIALRESRRPLPWFLAMTGLVCVTPFLQSMLTFVESTIDGVKSMRADSTRVRETLGEIAIERWWNEAPIWGHGIVERGPHIVEEMPIGSHHTWYGLLFVKGIVGAISLLVPLIWSLCEFAILTLLQKRSGQMAFAIVLLMFVYTIGENLEILSYLMWPGLIVIGIAARDGAMIRQEAIKSA